MTFSQIGNALLFSLKFFFEKGQFLKATDVFNITFRNLNFFGNNSTETIFNLEFLNEIYFKKEISCIKNQFSKN